MNPSIITILRRTTIAILLLVIAWAVWQRPWEGDFARARGRLSERVDEYMTLRMADDWIKLYELAEPRQRKVVSLPGFLKHYGHGVIQLRDIEATEMDIDPSTRRARVTISADAELIPSRLPAQFRAGFREDHPEHLRQPAEHDLEWVWADGEWYFRMDSELVTGQAASGQPLQPLTPR